MNPHRINWTPERISRLSDMWNQGKTFSEIAEFFGTSRNAISGKVGRLQRAGILLSKADVQERLAA